MPASQKSNQYILFNRFPHIALNTILPSIDHWKVFYDEDGKLNAENLYEDPPSKEAHNWFQSLSLEGVQVLYIYGLGLGHYYFACKEWLREDPKRACVFLEEDPSLIKLFLTSDDAEEILNDLQVHLVLFSTIDLKKALHFICEYFLYAPFYVTALKSYQKKEAFQKVYKSIFIQSTLKFGLSNEFLIKGGEKFATNIYRNLLSLDGALDGKKLQQPYIPYPALICCGGPSLKALIPLIRQWQNKAIIFSGGSSTKVLQQAGIRPHFVYSIDPNIEEYRRQFYNTFFQTPLCFNLRVSSNVLPLHHGPKIYVSHLIYWKLCSWIEKELNIDFYGGSGGLFSTTMCLDLARRMGCHTLACVGLDLAFGETFLEKEQGKSERDLMNQMCIQQNIQGKKVNTNWELTLGKEWLVDYAKHHSNRRFVNITDTGVYIDGFEHISPLDVEEELFSNSFDVHGLTYSLTQNLSTIDTRRVEELLTTLSQSFTSCLERYTLLKDLLLKDLEIFNQDRKQIIHTCQQEVAYQLVLQDQEQMITQSLKRNLDLILKDPNSCKEEKEEGYQHFLEKIYTHLIQTCTFHTEQIKEQLIVLNTLKDVQPLHT